MGIIADFKKRFEAEKQETNKSITPPPYIGITKPKEEWLDAADDVNHAANEVNDAVAELKEVVQQTKKLVEPSSSTGKKAKKQKNNSKK